MPLLLMSSRIHTGRTKCCLADFQNLFSLPAWILVSLYNSPLNTSPSALLQRTPQGSGISITERDKVEEMVQSASCLTQLPFPSPILHILLVQDKIP